MKTIVLALAALLVPATVLADCMPGKDGEIVSIEVKSCRKISPALDATIALTAGENLDPKQIDKLYTGALITDSEGRQWVYTSAEGNPCGGFPIGAVAKKAAYEACCDTGPWGKCVFGGSFLGEPGGPKINAFQ